MDVTTLSRGAVAAVYPGRRPGRATTVAAELPVYAGTALVGAALGKMIGRRILSGRTTRFVRSGILRVTGLCAC